MRHASVFCTHLLIAGAALSVVVDAAQAQRTRTATIAGSATILPATAVIPSGTGNVTPESGGLAVSQILDVQNNDADHEIFATLEIVDAQGSREHAVQVSCNGSVSRCPLPVARATA
jgi:hypothetical protein